MKKSGLLLALAVATIFCAACQKDNKKDNVAETSVTFRFVATEDLQNLYEIKFFWSVGGGTETTGNVTCNQELDEKFVFANLSSMKPYLKGYTYTAKGFTTSTQIDYRLTFTRKASVQIDTTAKYNIVFGQDLTTYGNDYVASTDCQILGFKGLKGSKVEEYVDRAICEFYEEDKSVYLNL